MRFLKLISWVLLCGILSVAAQTAVAESARTPGHIVAAKVRGSVIATNLADQTPIDLKDGSIISQNYVVTTGAGSGVILLLSNGATLNLGPESTLSIDEFLQDPFAEEIALADLKEEPTTSVTKLHLSRGELVGNVKKIKAEEGSSFTVNTPVGAAGIRGTTFRIVFRPDASGRVFFTLSTAEGRVVFEAPATQEQVSVPTGQEVVVTVDVAVDAATGAVTITAPPAVAATTDIPPATQAAIAAASQQIVEASAAAIISTTQQAEADRAAAEKAAAEKAATDKAAADKEAADQAAADRAAADKAAADKAAEDDAAKEQPGDNTDNSPPPAPQQPQQQTTSGDGR